MFNAISKLSKDSEFIVGISRGSCRPFHERNENCHYKNTLSFIEKYNDEIKYIFLIKKGVIF